MLKAKSIKSITKLSCAALMALVFMITSFGFQQTAYGSTGVTDLEVIVSQQEEDATVTAELFLHNPAGMAAGQLEATYDSGLFILQELSPGALLDQEGFILQANTEEDGVFKVGWFALAGVNKSGTLMQATFRSETEEALELHLQNIRLFDMDGTPMPFGPGGIRLQIGTAEAWVSNIASPLKAAPYIEEQAGTIMVPVRFISEQLGAEVIWLPETRQIRILGKEKSIQLTIDSDKVLVDGEEESLEASPVIINGSTFVPLYLFREMLGAAVTWDEETQTISVTAVEEIQTPPESRVIINGKGATFTNVKFLINLEINADVNFGGTVTTSKVKIGNDVTINFTESDTVWYFTGDVNIDTFHITLGGAAATITGNANAVSGSGNIIFNEEGLTADGIVFKADVEVKEDATFKDVVFDTDLTVTVPEDKTLTLAGEIEVADGYTVTFTGDGYIVRDEATITGNGNVNFAGPNM